MANSDWALEPGGVEVQHGDAVVARVVEGKVVLALQAWSRARTAPSSASSPGMGCSGTSRPRWQQAAIAARAAPHELGARRDLRSLPTITVDAPSTRDIDDAISVLPAGADGALRLLVSIADVGEFVTEGSLLDAAARERATSVYLAGHVLPMLPEELSSHWLSLVQGEERRCLTVELRIDTEGRVTAADVYESLIRSWARLNYDEVADFLDKGRRLRADGAGARGDAVVPRGGGAAGGGARGARRHRDVARRGALHLRQEHRPGVRHRERARPTSAHKLMERFMVAANEAIAEWMLARGLPALFRIQDEPDPLRVADLAAVRAALGLRGGLRGRGSRRWRWPRSTGRSPGAAAEPALRSVLRRSLGPARYTVVPSGHFGLAAKWYLHFTSPIRRYADLGRCTARSSSTCTGAGTSRTRIRPWSSWPCTSTRGRARPRARRQDRHRVLEARLMASHVGKAFLARITRVKPFGLHGAAG